MSKNLYIWIPFLVLCLLKPFDAWAGQSDFASHEVLIRYKASVAPNIIASFEAGNNLTLLQYFKHLNVRYYKLPSSLTVLDAIKILSQSPIVESVEPNYYRRPMFIPTDAHFRDQWGLHNTGQTVNGRNGVADIDINWPEAMDLFQANGPVIVAIIDSGIALDHPELIQNAWTNSAEIASNGMDDDGNGYVDDVIGWDFFDSDNIPLDENGHGTLVASTIAASMDNGEGGVGVEPFAHVMALRALNDFGRGASGRTSIANFIESSTYAARMGARIINASFGGAPFSPYESDQIDWLDSQGILLIAAAGNGGNDFQGDNNDLLPVYPASYPGSNIIAVAAVDRTGELAAFSNFGATSVDLAAPGTDMFGADVSHFATYSESFETGAPGWTVGQNPGSSSTLDWSLYLDGLGRTWITDSVGNFGGVFDYLPNTDSWVKSPVITVPALGPQLSYRVWHALTIFDIMGVEVSTDGINWDLVDYVLGFSADACPSCATNAGSIRSIDLSAYAGQSVQIRFRLYSDGLFQSDGAYIDDVALSEVGLFQFDGTQFRFNDGTSFSAPLVSGVAALLMAQRPDLTHHQIRQLIIDHVTTTAGLAGQVVSGGRLNAKAALAAAIAMPLNDQPAVAIGGTVNGASFSQQGGISPGSLVSVFGQNLSSSTALAGSLPLPVSLGGTRVSLSDIAAHLVFISPGQINLQIPWELTGQTQALIASTVAGVTGNTDTISLATFSPGIFSTNQSGSGQGAIQIANSGGIFAAPVGALPGVSSKPAMQGDFLSIFCTGLGPVNNQPSSGAPAPDGNSTTTSTPVVTIAGKSVPVTFSGLSPGFIGLYQVNVQITASVQRGNALPVKLTIGGVTSNTVTVAIQ